MRSMAHSEVHHDYHLVDPSPWPIVGSIAVFTMLAGGVLWMNKDYAAFAPLNGQPYIFLAGFAHGALGDRRVEAGLKFLAVLF